MSLSPFLFPGEPSWNEERESIEFPVVLGEYNGIVYVPRRVFHDILGIKPAPEQCVELAWLHRDMLERVTEEKLRNRDIGEDTNVHVTTRDVRRLSR